MDGGMGGGEISAEGMSTADGKAEGMSTPEGSTVGTVRAREHGSNVDGSGMEAGKSSFLR